MTFRNPNIREMNKKKKSGYQSKRQFKANSEQRRDRKATGFIKLGVYKNGSMSKGNGEARGNLCRTAVKGGRTEEEMEPWDCRHSHIN